VSAVDVGHLIVKVGDVRLAELRAGHIVGGSLNVFDAVWMRTQFDAYRIDLLHEHERLDGTTGITLDFDSMRRISQQMVKRLIATIRDGHHGGMILYVPHDKADELLRSAIHLKYSFANDAARRRYRALMIDIMHQLTLTGAAMTPPPASVGYDVYQHSARKELVELDEAVFEMAQLLAGLADVDGAVVITDQLELLGFGAEIMGPPDVATVRQAHDLEATSFHTTSIERFGTRHRSAYRLCAFEPACLAIVVSQDGGVQFVKSLNGAVTVWEQGQALL
jgi:hypothetical protein